MKKFIVPLLVLCLILTMPIAYGYQDTYVRKTEFDAAQFILGLGLEIGGIYVFCLAFKDIRIEEEDDIPQETEESKFDWGYAILGTIMMIVGADWMYTAWTVKYEKVSQVNNEHTYLIVSRRF
jgi:hypothetical protein